MIVGRGPGAPSVTPDMVFTLSRRADGGASAGAVDLGAIRRTDAIVDLLASRRLRQPSVLQDPAVLLLGALAADVDVEIAAAVAADGASVGERRDVGGRQGLPGCGHPDPSLPASPAGREPVSWEQSAVAWLRTAAAAAVVATMAGAATTTGIAVTGMLMRLARQATSEPRSAPTRPWAAGVLRDRVRR